MVHIAHRVEDWTANDGGHVKCIIRVPSLKDNDELGQILGDCSYKCFGNKLTCQERRATNKLVALDEVRTATWKVA